MSYFTWFEVQFPLVGEISVRSRSDGYYTRTLCVILRASMPVARWSLVLIFLSSTWAPVSRIWPLFLCEDLDDVHHVTVCLINLSYEMAVWKMYSCLQKYDNIFDLWVSGSRLLRKYLLHLRCTYEKCCLYVHVYFVVLCSGSYHT